MEIEIINQLSSKIDKTLVSELIREYTEVKKSFLLEDDVGTITHAGIFSEITMAILKNALDGTVVDINKIGFNSLYDEMINSKKTTGEQDLLFLAIPRTTRAIYTIRNKKRVAHMKTLNPNRWDAEFVSLSCDWILSSLLFLYHTKDEKEISAIINSLIEKKIPFVQTFEDGGIVVLQRGIDFKWEILIVLHNLNQRVTNEELKRIMKPRYSQLLTSNLARLEVEKMIHRNEGGSIITRLGIKKVEEDLIKY